MLSSDEKTIVPSLIAYNNSDMFNLGNVGTSALLKCERMDTPTSSSILTWETVVDYLPLKFYRLIESYANIYTTEKFDPKYIRNPKLCAYDRYGTTNMWRLLMILNRCPSANLFKFDYIRYYNISTLNDVISVIMARVQNDG
jgi:hypothetical protein